MNAARKRTKVSIRSGRVLSVFGLPNPRHAFVDAVDLVIREMFGIRPSSEKREFLNKYSASMSHENYSFVCLIIKLFFDALQGVEDASHRF
jgi:hypothetical protein